MIFRQKNGREEEVSGNGVEQTFMISQLCTGTQLLEETTIANCFFLSKGQQLAKRMRHNVSIV